MRDCHEVKTNKSIEHRKIIQPNHSFPSPTHVIPFFSHVLTAQKRYSPNKEWADSREISRSSPLRFPIYRHRYHDDLTSRRALGFRDLHVAWCISHHYFTDDLLRSSISISIGIEYEYRKSKMGFGNGYGNGNGVAKRDDERWR